MGHSKENHQNMKRQPTKRKDVLANHIPVKGLTPHNSYNSIAKKEKRKKKRSN